MFAWPMFLMFSFILLWQFLWDETRSISRVNCFHLGKKDGDEDECALDKEETSIGPSVAVLLGWELMYDWLFTRCSQSPCTHGNASNQSDPYWNKQASHIPCSNFILFGLSKKQPTVYSHYEVIRIFWLDEHLKKK